MVVVFIITIPLVAAAEEKLETDAQYQYIYYKCDSYKIKLGRYIGYRIEERATISHKDGYTIIQFSCSDEGTIFNSCFVIKDSKVIFNFSFDTQADFNLYCGNQFDKFLSKKGIQNPDDSLGRRVFEGGTLYFDKDIMVKYGASFYTPDPGGWQNVSYYHIIVVQYDLQTGRKIDSKVLNGKKEGIPYSETFAIEQIQQALK